MENIAFKLNGKAVSLDTSGERPLLWVLRTDLGLTGTKPGCGAGVCGACTVLVDKKVVRSCQTRLKEVGGKDVLTIEGLAPNGKLHSLQEAFVKHDAMQCGFCTPGMVMAAYGLLLSNPQPTEAQIKEFMEINLCRCGGYGRILQAIQSAAQGMKGAEKR